MKTRLGGGSVKRMTGFAWALAPVVVVASLVSGCGEPAPEETTDVALVADIEVSSDPGRGVGNAEIVAGGRLLTTTDAKGHASVSLRGTEGDAVELAIRCPTGFQSPPPIAVSLRALSADSRAPSFAARCAPLTRVVVVGIRADNGPGLPVLYLGKEVGRTDAWGAAHVVLDVHANEQVTLTLDTKAGGDKRPKLRPESPTLTFMAKDKDDFVTLDQNFEIERAPAARPQAPARGGPTRI